MGTMGSPKKGPHAESPNLTMAVAQIWSLFSKNTFAGELIISSQAGGFNI